MGMMGTSVQIRTTTRLTVIVMEMIGKTCFSHPITLRIQVISTYVPDGPTSAENEGVESCRVSTSTY